MAPKTDAPAAPKKKIDLAPLAAEMESCAAIFTDASRKEHEAHGRAIHGHQLERIAHFEALQRVSAAHTECVKAEAAYLEAKAKNEA